MIVLDTNVLSEPMRPKPDETVLGWLGRQPVSLLFTTTICEAEIFLGLALLAEGQRRSGLEAAARAVFDEDFAGRILPFDRQAAREFAAIVAGRRQAGRPIAHADAQIAAIAKSRGARIATRNVADFEGCGIPIVSPWTP